MDLPCCTPSAPTSQATPRGDTCGETQVHWACFIRCPRGIFPDESYGTHFELTVQTYAGAVSSWAIRTLSHGPDERAHGHESIAVRAPRCVSLARLGSHEVAEDVMLVKFAVKHTSVDFPV